MHHRTGDGDQERLSDLLLQWEESVERGSERPAHDLCRDCPQLLAELQRQIQQLRSLQPLLDTKDGDSHDTAGRSQPATTNTLPEKVATESRYQVMRLHASGGKGQVHVARDDTLGRDVAIKCVHPQYAAASASSRRLKREAEIAGRLKHPGIVPVYGMGTDEQERPFYCMQLVSGATLRESIREFHDQAGTGESQRRLRFRQLLRHFIDVCDTVAYAHAQGVVHRDIKPENIMLGAFGETFLVDWGLARLDGTDDDLAAEDGGPSGDHEEFTREGSSLGTPGYMSPEQARGDPVGKASDIFNLGATLYSVLTGRRPYEGNHVVDVIQAASQSKFPAPRSLRRTIPPALEAICLRAMQEGPAARYASARDLAADLERWLADEPVSVHRESLPERLGRWGRRHRALAAGTSLVLLVATVSLGIATVLINGERNKTRIAWASSRENFRAAERQREAAERNFQRALSAVDTFYTLVSQNRLLNVPGLQPLRKELLTESLSYYQSFVEEHQDDASLSRELAGAHERVADLLQEIDSREKAIEHSRRAIAIRRRLFHEAPGDGRAQLDLARALMQLSILLMDLGRFAEADGELSSALDHARKALATHDDADAVQVELARALIQKGSIAMHDGSYTRSLETYREAMALCRLLRDRGQGDALGDMWATLHYNIGSCERLRGAYDPALSAYRQAVRELERLVESSPGVHSYLARIADTCNQMAFIERKRDNVPAAMEALDRSRGVMEALVQSDPDVHEYRNNLGVLYTELGRLVLPTDAEAAEKWFTLAAEVRQRLADENPTDIEFRFNAAAAVCSLALLDLEQEKFASARDHFLTAVEAFREMERSAPQDPQIRDGLACVYQQLGNAHQGVGETEAAREARQTALAIFRDLLASHGSALTEISATLVSLELADSLEALDLPDDAREILTQRARELGTSPHVASVEVAVRETLGETMSALIQALRDREEDQAVMQLVRTRATLFPDDPEVLYHCATHAIWCGEQDGRAFARYADQAIEWLGQAVAAGLEDVDRLAADPQLDAVRQLPAFIRLLEDQALPETEKTGRDATPQVLSPPALRGRELE